MRGRRVWSPAEFFFTFIHGQLHNVIQSEKKWISEGHGTKTCSCVGKCRNQTEFFFSPELACFSRKKNGPSWVQQGEIFFCWVSWQALVWLLRNIFLSPGKKNILRMFCDKHDYNDACKTRVHCTGHGTSDRCLLIFYVFLCCAQKICYLMAASFLRTVEHEKDYGNYGRIMETLWTQTGMLH